MSDIDEVSAVSSSSPDAFRVLQYDVIRVPIFSTHGKTAGHKIPDTPAS